MAPLAIKVGLHAFSSYLEWGHRAHKVELPFPYTQGDTQYDSLHQEQQHSLKMADLSTVSLTSALQACFAKLDSFIALVETV